MKIVIINGSPRKGGNTSLMCESFSKGVLLADPNAEIITINLYDYQYHGCISCFSCKKKNGKSYGKCGYKDALSPILERASSADCLVLATPIYLMDVSSAMKAFLERICFSYGSYEIGYKSLAPKKMPTVTIYTMNCTSEQAPYTAMDNIDIFIGHVFSIPERLCAFNTYQFNDYNRYVVEVFNEREKALYRSEKFPIELEEAYTLGYKIASNSQKK